MLVFNCTKAFAEFIDHSKEPVVERPPTKIITEDPSFQGGTSMHWVVHLVTLKRKNYTVAMHVESLYAIVMVGVERGDFEGFVDAFCNRLINEMFFLCAETGLVGEEHASLVAENFVDKHPDVCVYRRCDQGVQAHIDDVVCSLGYEVETMGGFSESPDDAFEFGRHVNMLLRKTQGATDCFYPFEVMQERWFADVCVEIVDPESLDRLWDTPLPGNVIVLADHRKAW